MFPVFQHVNNNMDYLVDQLHHQKQHTEMQREEAPIATENSLPIIVLNENEEIKEGLSQSVEEDDEMPIEELGKDYLYRYVVCDIYFTRFRF